MGRLNLVTPLLAIVVVIAACSDQPAARATSDAGGADAGSSLYDPRHILEVELTVAADDWDQLRSEGRSLPAVMSGCDDPEFGYTVVSASARIDGMEVAALGVRKKGFLGSLSNVRPSLRLDFAEYDPSQTFAGSKTLTLNNSRQDPSLLHQCVAYAVFERAGVPAPRCSFAHVRVNGDDLGVYVNVEPIKKPLLRRYFDDDSGNLYEGSSGADFRDDMLAMFEKKTHESDPDRSDLQAVSTALQKTGKAMLEAVEPLVDVDAFLRFWAVETLVAHWDGYAGDLNNFFVYHDPTSDKLVFVPWGTDGAFTKSHPFLPSSGRPPLTYAWSRLAGRLYAYAPTRQRYRDTLATLLDEVWNEDALLADIAAWSELLGDVTGTQSLQALRDFIEHRRDEVRAELDADATAWLIAERSANRCDPTATTAIRGTFATTWDTLEAPTADATATLTVQLSGMAQSLASLRSGAGISKTPEMDGAAVRVLGFRADGSFVLTQLGLGPAHVAPGTVPFHGFETLGFAGAGTTPTDFGVAGLIGDGAIVLDRAGSEPGDPVEGHFEGVLVRVTSLNVDPNL